MIVIFQKQDSKIATKNCNSWQCHVFVNSKGKEFIISISFYGTIVFYIHSLMNYQEHLLIQGMKCGPGDFDCGLMVGARWAGFSISDTADLQGFPHTRISRA